jgi:FAD/FMN-containing dehydrogenase
VGLEAVLPNGEVWNGLSRLRKDNTGYDLKNLLIGAEGSLGIITAASLKLFPRPTSNHAALTLLARCQAGLAGMVSAFELIHRQGLDFLAEKLPQIRVPAMGSGDWYALIDLGVTGDVQLADRFETLLANALEDGLISDALIAQNAAQRQEFWTVRETIPEANRLIGAIYSHDISVPVSRIPDLIERGQALIKTIGDLRINCFGHVGDGNLHYNIYPPKGKNRADYLHLLAPIKEAIYGLVYELGGSMSAEHGIGRMYLADLQRYGDPAKLAAMRAIKKALDPVGILNPGAVVDFGAGGSTDG